MEPEQVVMEPGVVVYRRWQRSLLTFLMVFGPGLIVMDADNDAGTSSGFGVTKLAGSL